MNVAGTPSTSASNNNTSSAAASGAGAGAGSGAGSVGATGRGRLLRRLTHVAFDYQIGRESGHGGMGIGVWGAGNFVGIVREALAAGGLPAPPPPLDGGGLLAPHAEDGEGEGSAQGSGMGLGQGLGQGQEQQEQEQGGGAGSANGDGGAGAGAGGGEGILDMLDYLDELGEAPPLERVVVKIILRPRAEVLSKFNAIWPRLDALRKADATARVLWRQVARQRDVRREPVGTRARCRGAPRSRARARAWARGRFAAAE
jgi:hypothetical protein